MNIISYNVNGIRAAIKKGFDTWVEENDFDIICLQETKAQKEQVDLTFLEKMGYHIYWFSAEKKGYSSVAIFTKVKPKSFCLGQENKSYDLEGRTIRLDFENFTLINTYFPSGTTGGVRQDFKYQFLDDYKVYIEEIKKEQENIIVLGDYNIAHTEIDIHNPKSNKNSSGFLPEERAWLTKWFEDGFIDTFRYFHKDKIDEYSWWSYRANSRNNNKGWRIDYISASKSMENQLKDASILQHVKHSDHCPLFLELK